MLSLSMNLLQCNYQNGNLWDKSSVGNKYNINTQTLYILTVIKVLELMS